jgi:hypothetical protein
MNKFNSLICFGVISLMLYSCQTEDVINSAPSNIHKPADGIPSRYDDQFEFSKKSYFANNKLITDTLEIKELLNKAVLTEEDGNRIQIYFDRSELAKHGIIEGVKSNSNDENINSDNKASSDADDHLTYFFEEAEWWHNSGQIVWYKYATRAGGANYKGTWMKCQWYNANKQLTTNGMIQGVEIAGSPITQSNSNLSSNFTINVINTSRFARKVTFVLEKWDYGVSGYNPEPHSNVYKIYILQPRQGKSIHGYAWASSVANRAFGGATYVIPIAHYSTRKY